MPSIYSEAYATPVMRPAGAPDDGARRCVVTSLPLPPAPAPPPRQLHLPARWEEHQTDAGEPYFYNTQTGQSRWTRPDPESTSDVSGGLVTRSV